MLNGARDYSMWDAAYVLGALSDADRREFETHLVGCASCRTAVTELTAVSPLLSLLHYDDVVAPDCADESAAAPPCPDLMTSLLAKADQRSAASQIAPNSLPPGSGARWSMHRPSSRSSAPATMPRPRRTDRVRSTGARQHPRRTQRLVPAQRPKPAHGRGATGVSVTEWSTGFGWRTAAPRGTATVGCAPKASTIPFPALQRRRHPKPALQHRQYPCRSPRRQNACADGILAAL